MHDNDKDYCSEDEDDCHMTPTSSTDPDILIAAMVYNFALSHHLAAHYEVQRQGYHLHRAQRLYRFAFEILQKLECDSESIKLCLAITNNMAALALECHDYALFNTCREWIGVLLTHVDESFYASFFVDNFASVAEVQQWPAPAA